MKLRISLNAGSDEVKPLSAKEAKLLSDTRSLESFKEEGYTEDQIKTIRNYTKLYYSPINMVLRGQSTGDTTTYAMGEVGKKDVLSWINLLEQAFKNKNSVLKKDLILFRSISLPTAEILNQISKIEKLGKTTILDKGFLSTSLLKHSGTGGWESYAKGTVNFEIHAPLGTSAIIVGGASAIRGDKEVLLNKNTKLLVTTIKDKKVRIFNKKEQKQYRAPETYLESVTFVAKVI